MSIPDVAAASLQQLADSYRRAAVAHGRATAAGDYRTANRHHEILASVYRELRTRGPAAQSILLPLMQDVDDAVRVWAATHALEFVPGHAEPILDEFS